MAFAGISQTAAIGTPTLSHTSLTLWPSQVMAFLKGQRVQTEGHGDIPAQRLCHLPHHQDLHGHPFQDHLPQVRPHCKDENPLAWGYEQGWLFAGEINGAETCRLGYHPMWGTARDGKSRGTGTLTGNSAAHPVPALKSQELTISALEPALPTCHK